MTTSPPPTTSRLASEQGSMLVELLIAMTFLSIAVGALLSVYSSTISSLRRASIAGTALSLADRQIEAYKTLPFDDIKLAAATIPSSGADPYVTAHSSDSTVPAASPQETTPGGDPSLCVSPVQAQPQCAVQTITGPDGRPYRVDSYVATTSNPAGGRTVRKVTVTVRKVVGGTPGTIRARVTSVFDVGSPAS